jgi:CheY-like chemotaxis protein
VASPYPKSPKPTHHRDRPFRESLSEDLRRVLIVADASTSIQIAALLHSIGRFETRIACSADLALGIARCFFPDIVLVSIDRPGLSSYRLAAALRWDSTMPAPRLIALGGRDCAPVPGFEQYLALPLQSAALESALVPRLSDPEGKELRGTRQLRFMRSRQQQKRQH